MRLLGIAGTKRAGKSSAANFILANELKNLDLIEKFEVTDDGSLLVNHSEHHDEVNNVEAGMGLLNLDCKDPLFIQWLALYIWPHVKLYSFADMLKFIAINMYGLTTEQVYGTTKEKESVTQYTYKQLKKIVPGRHFPKTLQNLDDNVIARKFVQYLADTLLELNDDCFINPIMNQIEVEQVPLSIVTDVRRTREVDRIKAAGGKVLYLSRRTESDNHRIENGFVDIKNPEDYFDIVIDNQDLTMDQKNVEIYTSLKSIGWLS